MLARVGSVNKIFIWEPLNVTVTPRGVGTSRYGPEIVHKLLQNVLLGVVRV